jgi:Protein of unknown function (DUF3383)
VGLESLLNIQIKVQATAPSSANFGVPAVFAYHTHFVDLIRYYDAADGLTAMVSDGFAVTEPAYLAAAEILDQRPTVTQFAVARRALPPTQVLRLACSSTSNRDTYAFTIVGSDGVKHAISVASTGVPATDAASIVTALGAPITNIGTPVVTGGTTVQITQAAGKLNDLQGWAGLGAAGAPILALSDTTADPGIATDLAAVYAVDQGWYGFTLDSNSAAEIEAAATWAEANGAHAFSTNNSDAADLTNGASVFKSLYTSGWARTLCQFNGSRLLCYAGAALLGVILPQTPGSYTAAYKTEVGVPDDPPSILTANAVTNLTTNNGNYYLRFKGVAVLISGITPSGEFLDTTIFIDWLKDALVTAIFTLLVANPKVGYDDLGVGKVVNVIKGVLKQGIQNGGLAASPAPTVSAPLVADVDSSDVAKRNLPDVTFTATLDGAIQGLQVLGSVVLS